MDSAANQLDHSLSFRGQNDKRPRLGQILVGAGLVEPETLHDCLREARITHQKLGAILLEKKVLAGPDLVSALVAQKLVADGTMAETACTKILTKAVQEKIDMFAALDLERTNKPKPERIAELCELLLGTGMVNAGRLAQTQALALAAGMSLGKALLLTNTLTTENLDAFLIMIALLRKGGLSTQAAIKRVRALRQKHMEINRENLQLPTRTNSCATLGELLIESECIVDFECLFAIETALATDRQLGQVLVQTGRVAKLVVHDALLLQSFVASGVILESQALQALKLITEKGLALTEVAKELRLFQDSATDAAAVQFLLSAGYLSDETVARCTAQQARLEMDASKALLSSGILRASLMASAKICVSALQSGALTREQALVLIQQAERPPGESKPETTISVRYLQKRDAQAKELTFASRNQGHKPLDYYGVCTVIILILITVATYISIVF